MSENKSGNTCKKCGKTIEWTPESMPDSGTMQPCLKEAHIRAAELRRDIVMNSSYCSDCLSEMPREIVENLLSIPKNMYNEIMSFIKTHQKSVVLQKFE
ncbi:MAG: hypothetical protein ACOZCL_12885 [Bacillota bacterium]